MSRGLAGRHQRRHAAAAASDFRVPRAARAGPDRGQGAQGCAGRAQGAHGRRVLGAQALRGRCHAHRCPRRACTDRQGPAVSAAEIDLAKRKKPASPPRPAHGERARAPGRRHECRRGCASCMAAHRSSLRLEQPSAFFGGDADPGACCRQPGLRAPSKFDYTKGFVLARGGQAITRAIADARRASRLLLPLVRAAASS